MSKNKLVMAFEANTIKHLGLKMYSNLPPALAELIANAYDACASLVKIKFIEEDEKKIIIEDDGTGMTFDEVNNYFLRIGRNRRDEGQTNLCNRIPTGKKGLGKLALFGIGEQIDIKTGNGKEGVQFILNWEEILNWSGSEYTPKFSHLEAKDMIRGTIITLTKLKRVSAFPINDYVMSISKLFNWGDDFRIEVSLNNSTPISIDNKLKFNNINAEFEWDITALEETKSSSYNDLITGKIVTTATPLSPNSRGITLFANGRMINQPEFFGPSESSHFFSYCTGWLNVNFIDNLDDDVIATNRQSIDWENQETIRLRDFLSKCLAFIERDWRKKRKELKNKSIKEESNIDTEEWVEKLPERIQNSVTDILDLIGVTPELSIETQSRLISSVHTIAPEYADLHWRNLEPEIQFASERYYQNKDYFNAFIEALKKYLHLVRQKSGSPVIEDYSMVGNAFGKSKLLEIANIFKKTDGSDFSIQTYENIQDAQRLLSQGMVAGGRNPLQHEEHGELIASGLFTEKDCLDYLSLLSHLYKRFSRFEHSNSFNSPS